MLLKSSLYQKGASNYNQNLPCMKFVLALIDKFPKHILKNFFKLLTHSLKLQSGILYSRQSSAGEGRNTQTYTYTGFLYLSERRWEMLLHVLPAERERECQIHIFIHFHTLYCHDALAQTNTQLNIRHYSPHGPLQLFSS